MANLSNWYESKSLVVQALVDLVCQRTSFVLKEAEIDRFLLMLADMVLNRKTSLQIHSSVSTRVIAKGCLPKQLLKQSNSAQLWHELIQFDFYKFVFNRNTYFFKRNF